MKNVKVILISVVLCAAVFANSRIDALGGDAGFWAGDRANIGSFPATINDHDFVEIDNVGAGDGVNATILWGDATTWGFNFDGDDTDTWINIMWGNGDVGLNIGYKANDTDGADVSGFDVSYGQNFDWGELGVGFSSVDDESEYWANWRDDMSVWVFDSAKASLYSYDNGLSGDFNVTYMSLGFDMFTHLDAGGADVLFGLGVDYATFDNNGIGATTMTLPSATIAVEASLTDWATLRAWASHQYIFSCTDDGFGLCEDDKSGPYSTWIDTDAEGEAGHGEVDTELGNGTTYGFGLGFNWGQATLDMTIGESLFTDPVSTMTGYDEGASLANAEVTLSYSF